MKGKHLLAAILAASMIVSLWGCSSSTNQETTAAETAAGTSAAETAEETAKKTGNDEQVTLRMSWWGGDSRHAATIAAVELYESTHPGVKIELEYSSWDGYMDKVMTQLAGGTQPDIMQIQATSAMELTDSFPDTFVALDSQDILDLSAFNQVMEDSFCRSAQGGIVAVPTGINSYNILVNKTVTNAAGIELPKNMTWDEFFEYGKKIHEANPDFYMITSGDDGWNHLMRSYARQLSGQWTISEDGEVIGDRDALVETFTTLQRMYAEGIAEPMETAFAYNADASNNPKLLNNEIACLYCPFSGLTVDTSAWTDGVDVVNIPIMEGARNTGVITQPTSLWMVSQSDQEEEALKFLQWIFDNEEAIKTLADCRGVPATDKARDVLEKENLANPLVSEAAAIALEVTDTAVPVINENTLVYDYMFPLIQEICYQMITPEDAADQMIQSLNEIVEEIK